MQLGRNEWETPLRILLAEDDARMCKAIHSALHSEWPDAQITVVNDGDEATDILGDADRRFDLLVTDLVMPGRDGFAVISFSRQFSPRTRIVAMTGDFAMSQTFALAQAVCCGAHAVLPKPFSAAELLEAVRQAM